MGESKRRTAESGSGPKSQSTPSGTPSKSPPPGKAEPAPTSTPTTATTAAEPPPMEALQGFVNDHPQFMRILQNPKKCLGDPRMKAMFVKELENYPVVKKFFASKM